MIRWTYPLGKVLGIPVTVHIFFFYTLLVSLTNPGPLGRLGSLFAILVLFLCVLLHEIGHCLAARHYGIAVESIMLWPLGGVATIKGLDKVKPNEEFGIAIAGPIVSFVLACLFFMLYTGIRIFTGPITPRANMQWEDLGELFATMNMALAVFNLLPIYPMDGGRVLRAAATWWAGPDRGMEVAALVSNVLGVLVAIVAVYYDQISLAIIMLLMTLSARAELLSKRSEKSHEKVVKAPSDD